MIVDDIASQSSVVLETWNN